MDIFGEYAPFVQDFIYKNAWENLRAIQVAAGDVLFHSDDNLLLTAQTASGKTEAAFFPIISQFYENPPASVGCIYIGPLKALINDQFHRLNDLCEEAEIPVWHWHGDVAQSHKDKLLRRPSGILQITPESLEAILLHKHSAVPALFCDLRYIVIDEVHSLLRGDRGGQTLCLIERLCRLANVNPRRIGLSATMGDPIATGAFLSMGTGRKTAIPQTHAKAAKWNLSVEHFYIREEANAEGQKNAELPPCADPSYAYLYTHTQGKKCLIFVNSREECEAVTTSLRRLCERAGRPDRFLIHHGNLSASFRETAEEIMKDDSSLQTTVTTATLELGIDIGRLERAFQIDATWTVSGFLQRLGRTGRRGAPPEMHFVIREDEPEARAMLPATIAWKLLQAIAVVQLYTEEGWVEPPRLSRLPFSLLYHQTMSVLASCGEMSPAALAERVLTLTYFHTISQEDYKELLLHLLETGHIEKTERGGLIVGLAGERVINSFKFYGVFREDEEFTVRWESQELGTIVLPPPVGEKIAIAGCVWTVLDVDVKKHIVYCEPVKGSVPAYFGLCPGDLHTKVLERMRRALKEDAIYPYLKPSAVTRLIKTRQSAQNAKTNQEVLISLGGDMYCLLPWLGTYAFLALERLLNLKCAKRLGLRNLNSSRPFYMQFHMKASRETFFTVLFEETQKELAWSEFLYPNEVPVFDKYDEYIPPQLRRKGFALGVLDIDGMKSRVQEWQEAFL